MRLFVFAIGGTGARVLRSMVMQFAAGIVPVDNDNKLMEGLTVVPIIIDPHTDNKALQRANELLKRYQRIRETIYKKDRVSKGFYAVKIESLRDVTTTSDNPDNYKVPEGFFYDMPEIATEEFKNFIGINKGMSQESQLLSKMIFSEEELNTKMKEGFYGSPNIGTVALNVFQESESFKALTSCFGPDDRMIFVGSIFGGTGASGLPMFVSSFRNYNLHDEVQNANNKLPESRMGAIVVMPYFKIQQKDDSPIWESDFVIKTQSALKYYKEELYPYLNDVYYLADNDDYRKAFENDPGEGGQKNNLAHIVEFLAGLAIIDFAEKSGKFDVVKTQNRREVNGVTGFWQFGYESFENGTIMFANFGERVRKKIFSPMVQFQIFSSFLRDGHFETSISSTYAKGTNIDSSALTKDMVSMIDEYREWMYEMSSDVHGNSRFIPFNFIESATGDYKGMIAGSKDSNKFDLKDIVQALNECKNEYRDNREPSEKLHKMGFDATQIILNKKIKDK